MTCSVQTSLFAWPWRSAMARIVSRSPVASREARRHRATLAKYEAVVRAPQRPGNVSTRAAVFPGDLQRLAPPRENRDRTPGIGVQRFARPAQWASGLLAVALTCTAVPARAQAEDQAAARALFEQGRALLKSGRYAEACEKLEGASKLYTSAGILLNLGDCYAKSGRTASAWTEFGEAAAVAKRTGRTNEGAEASRRQAELAPALTRLTITVSHPVTGLAVTRDGSEVPEAAWGTAIPVDPGSHDIRAVASGYRSYTTSVTASGDGKTTSVEVPELEQTPSTEAPATEPAPLVASPPPSTEPTSTPPRRPSRALEWTLIGAGAAVGIGGGVLMAIEANKAHEATDANDRKAYDATATPWTIGLGGVIAGGVAAAVGVVLFTTRHGSEATTSGAIRVSPIVGKEGAGMLAGGSF